MSGLCPDIDPDSDSTYDGSSDEVSKDQENLDDQEQEEVVSVPCGNPRRIRRVDKSSLQRHKSDI